jgi:ribosome-associated protein
LEADTARVGVGNKGGYDTAVKPPAPDQDSAEDQDDIPARPSKSEIKRAMDALQDLGRDLVELPASVLARFELPDALRDAVREAQRFPQREARRRQLQYIGRLMRGIDPAPIAAQLAALRGESAAETARQHTLERWRERLLEADSALTDLLIKHPGADIQHLRQLIRSARQEAVASKPPKSNRALFRALRELLAEGRTEDAEEP